MRVRAVVTGVRAVVSGVRAVVSGVRAGSVALAVALTTEQPIREGQVQSKGGSSSKI